MSQSQHIFAKSEQLIPGGVNSPVRAWKTVGGSPVVIAHAQGPTITDVDGTDYIDYVLSWGPLILGHAPERIVEAVTRQVAKGLTYGAPTENELILAELIHEAIPSIDMIRLVNSGTEAVMTALRLARSFTGRPRILKFTGCYHGHSDALLAQAGSGLATFGIPACPGVADEVARLTISLPYNDVSAVTDAIDNYGTELAAVIVEPIAGNMGVVIPEPSFLTTIRRLTREAGIVLIFDEVITGFRLTWGGWQNVIGIQPDLTCLGKIIGGGLPIGAFGGRRDIMSLLTPIGPVYQAGTLSGNPVATTAGIETLRILKEDSSLYDRLDRDTAELCSEMAHIFHSKGINIALNRVGSMFTIFFTGAPVTDFSSASHTDTARYAHFFREMIRRGVYLPPSPFEAWFTSTTHGGRERERTINACREAASVLGREIHPHVPESR